jgi:hypothetical protein
VTRAAIAARRIAHDGVVARDLWKAAEVHAIAELGTTGRKLLVAARLDEKPVASHNRAHRRFY